MGNRNATAWSGGIINAKIGTPKIPKAPPNPPLDKPTRNTATTTVTILVKSVKIGVFI